MIAPGRRGVALAALVAIGLVTAAWWALALYPAATAPEWVNRTRLACFGAAPGGLPNAGGWILLAGEPLGMLAMLLAAFGDAVRRDLRWAASHVAGRMFLAACLVAVAWGTAGATSVARRMAVQSESFATSGVASALRTSSVPPLALTDQHGLTFELQEAGDGPVLVSFAFAHCETMCPTAIREILRIRSETGREDIPLVIVTVDPWRDVPVRLASIAATWNLADGDHVLSGTVVDVNAVLDTWGVARRRDEQTGDVVHPLVAFLVHRGGQSATRVAGSMEGLRTVLIGQPRQ
jgi:cytochrome oxidase Cu insertion factor (SCO1/SenC/PrrC family)